MADYDAGEITERERLAAARQKEIAARNAEGVKNQLRRQLANYDLADQQNAALRDVQLKQNERKAEADRFEAQRNLRNAALGLFGSMGNTAMNGSTLGNTMSMLRDRNDADNSVYWQQLMENRDTVLNAYDEAANQNQVAKNDAVINAEKALRDIEDDLSANLSNINPNLYQAPASSSDIRFNATELYNDNKVNPNIAKLAGYIMPENAEQTIRPQRNRVQRNDYFGNLMNRFNRR